jgi:hypothetical protein
MSGERIALLGAEKQAATSIALAYPERTFTFVSDQHVLDGWDLSNVRFQYSTPELFRPKLGEEAIFLCPRWLPTNRQRQLSELLPKLDLDTILPVFQAPVPGLNCIVKGDRRHRPDGTIVGLDLDPADVGDPYGCGTVYQPFWKAEQNLLVVGRRAAQATHLGIFRIHSESCARDDVLAAGETIADEFVQSQSLRIANDIRHEGFFSINWLRSGSEYRLTSFRPVPRAVFATLRNAGIDLLSPISTNQIANAGHKFVVDFTSYRRLVA